MDCPGAWALWLAARSPSSWQHSSPHALQGGVSARAKAQSSDRSQPQPRLPRWPGLTRAMCALLLRYGRQEDKADKRVAPGRPARQVSFGRRLLAEATVKVAGRAAAAIGTQVVQQ
jgi:hypothetical protein